MFVGLLVAAAVAGASPSAFNAESVDNVCGWSAEILVADGLMNDRDVWERYVGRMETRMMELHVAERDKVAFRTSCDIYLHGVMRGMNLLVRKQEQLATKARASK
jgi:hypothetical protein